MKNKLNEDGEGGGVVGGGEGMSTDILGGGSGDQDDLGVLGVGNFNIPVRMGQVYKRLISQYGVLNKKKSKKK